MYLASFLYIPEYHISDNMMQWQLHSDYKNWLDNISTGDTRANAYIMDKVTRICWKCYSNLETMNIQVSGSGGSSGYSGAGTWQNNINFPNFDNQFEGV